MAHLMGMARASMIPRRIHYCWFGRGALSALNQRCMATWRAVLPDYEQRWKELCNVGGLLRELQPFLYSHETAPEVTVKTIQGTVNAAAYKTADGKVKVLVTATGPGASEAEITVAGTHTLESRYGKTEQLGGDSHRFRGTDICSDVLE